MRNLKPPYLNRPPKPPGPMASAAHRPGQSPATETAQAIRSTARLIGLAASLVCLSFAVFLLAILAAIGCAVFE